MGAAEAPTSRSSPAYATCSWRPTGSQRASVRGPNAINFNSTNTRPAIVAVTIRDNRIGPVAGGGDAIQAKHTCGLVISHNEIFGVRCPAGSSSHPDVFQSIYGATGLTIKDNFIHDIAAQGIFQRFVGINRNFKAYDNVIARVAYPWVAFSATVDTITHNTIDGILPRGGRLGQARRQRGRPGRDCRTGRRRDPERYTSRRASRVRWPRLDRGAPHLPQLPRQRLPAQARQPRRA